MERLRCEWVHAGDRCVAISAGQRSAFGVDGGARACGEGKRAGSVAFEDDVAPDWERHRGVLGQCDGHA